MGRAVGGNGGPGQAGKGCPYTLGPGAGGAMWAWRVASQGWASKKGGQETGQQKVKSISGLPRRDRLVTSLDNRRFDDG